MKPIVYITSVAVEMVPSAKLGFFDVQIVLRRHGEEQRREDYAKHRARSSAIVEMGKALEVISVRLSRGEYKYLPKEKPNVQVD